MWESLHNFFENNTGPSCMKVWQQLQKRLQLSYWPVSICIIDYLNFASLPHTLYGTHFNEEDCVEFNLKFVDGFYGSKTTLRIE